MHEQEIPLDLWEEFNEELKKSEQLQINFQSGFNSNQTEGINSFFEIFLNEKLPEGQLNKILEKNFAVYIVQNKLDIEAIKKKYASQGWKVGGLLGWIKKVNKGELKNFNIGEVVNWSKENKPELVHLFNKVEEESNDLEFVWEKDLKNYKEKEIGWIAKGLIPARSIGILTGKRGSFKTFISLLFSTCVSLGLPVFNKYQTEKSIVLYVDRENGFQIIKERKDLIKNGLGRQEDLDISFIFKPLKLDKVEDYIALEKIVDQIKPKLLIIDTYRRVISFEEDSADKVSKFFIDVLQPLVDKYELTILLIHHDKKGNSGDEMDDIRGSSDMPNYVSFILKCEKHGNNIILKQLKCRNAREIEPLQIKIEAKEGEFIKFSSVVYVPQTKEEKIAEKILIWIKEENLETFTTKKAREDFKKEPKNSFFNALKVLEERGILTKTIRGVYSLNQGGGV